MDFLDVFTVFFVVGSVLWLAHSTSRNFPKHFGGRIPKSFEEYLDLASGSKPEDNGLYLDFMIRFLYPFLKLGLALWGVPHSSSSQAVPEPTLTIDITKLVAEFLLEVSLFPDKRLRKVFADAGESIIVENFTLPTDGKDWDAYQHRVRNALAGNPVDTLMGAFAGFALRVPMLGAGGMALTTEAAPLISHTAVKELFVNLRKGDYFGITQYRCNMRNLAAQIRIDQNPKQMREVTAEILKQPLEEDSDEHVRYLLSAIPALEDLTLPIGFPSEARFEGTWIVAPQGRGKTTLLSAMLKDDLKDVEKNAATIIIMDSKGDLIEHVRELRQFGKDGELEGKLTLIEPSANLAINPLDLGANTGHTINLLEYVFSALLEARTTPLQSTLFRSVLIALKSVPNANFSTFRQFLQDGYAPYEKYIRTLDQEDQDFFLKGEYDSATYQKTKQELLWRIRDLTTRVTMLRQMFRAPETKVNMAELLDSGRVIIIDNSTAQLSVSGSEFFGRFFIALILAAAQQRAGRAPEDKKPVFVYLDEAQTVIANDPNIATIIQTCRSQKIGMIFAHQELSQIKHDDVKSALANCAIRMANPDKDARALAADFRTSSEFLNSLAKGKFALFIRDFLRHPIVVSVPNNPVSAWPKMWGAELAAIRVEMRKLYSFNPPTDEKPEPPSEPEPTPQKWGQ